jgi:hypothetical protein
MTMANARMDLSTFVGKLLQEQDGDVLREGVRVLAQALTGTEVTALVGAERYERSEDRAAYRNGSRANETVLALAIGHRSRRRRRQPAILNTALCWRRWLEHREREREVIVG